MVVFNKSREEQHYLSTWFCICFVFLFVFLYTFREADAFTIRILVKSQKHPVKLWPKAQVFYLELNSPADCQSFTVGLC